MIQNINHFTKYFDGIRRRTLNYIGTIPPEQVNWRPQAGEFSIGELIRHLDAAEKMFVGVVVDGTWHYAGHDHDSNIDLETLLAHLAATHKAAMDKLVASDDAVLYQPRPTLNGPDVKAWRLLMAMVEHEVHHRSQLAMYLTQLNIKPPHIYGLGVEDVIALAVG
jgi:uncharacterized damage-inducible protein DinB